MSDHIPATDDDRHDHQTHPRPAKGDEEANAAVYAAIRAALLSGGIPAGEKLREPAIARALDVSRERVRRAIHRLAHEGLVRLVPNRGAFPKVPSLEEIEDVSEARRVVENALVGQLAGRGDRRAVARALRRHVREEEAAKARGDRAVLIALSASFHLLISELAGNGALHRFHRELMTASQFFYALHSPPELPRCGGPSEHPAIVAAIEAGDAAAAMRLMDGHLADILASMRQTPATPRFAGFASLFERLAT